MGVQGSRGPQINSVLLEKEQGRASDAACWIHGEAVCAITSILGPVVFHHFSTIWKTFSKSIIPVSCCHTEAVVNNALCPPQTPPPFKYQSEGQREHLMTAPD